MQSKRRIFLIHVTKNNYGHFWRKPFVFINCKNCFSNFFLFQNIVFFRSHPTQDRIYIILLNVPPDWWYGVRISPLKAFHI